MALTITVINACPDKESETLSKRDNSLFTAIQSIWKRCPAHEAKSTSKRSKESDEDIHAREQSDKDKIGKHVIQRKRLFTSKSGSDFEKRRNPPPDPSGSGDGSEVTSLTSNVIHVIQRKRLFSSKSGSDFEKRHNPTPSPSSNGGPDPPSGNIPGKRQNPPPPPPVIHSIGPKKY